MDPWILAHSVLAFFALAMTIISVWVKRSPWIWGSFLIIAFALAYFAKIVQPIALAPIGALLILHTLLKGDIRGLVRFILVTITIAISLALQMHSLPGFANWAIAEKAQISPGAYPFSLYLNFDKPFIGLFVLALGFPLIGNMRVFWNMMKTAIPMTIVGVAIMITLALTSGLIKWDPKLPHIFWFFLIENLIFVCIIEEAFWRGFVQNEITRIAGKIGAILITAFFFALIHYFWVPNFPFLALIFVAAVIYGSIYQYTRSLEASIFAHWTFNVIHFALFTYPALLMSSSS